MLLFKKVKEDLDDNEQKKVGVLAISSMKKILSQTVGEDEDAKNQETLAYFGNKVTVLEEEITLFKAKLPSDVIGVVRENVLDRIEQDVQSFRPHIELNEEATVLANYYDQTKNELEELLRTVPRIVEAKSSEENALNELYQRGDQPTTDHDSAAIGDIAARQIHELAQKRNKNTKRKKAQSVENSELRAEHFAGQFSESSREVMKQVALHTLRLYKALPNELRITSQGEICGPAKAGNAKKIDFDYRTGLPLIDGQKQKIYAIAQKQDTSAYVLQMKAAGFAEGTPMLMGGTIEARHFLLLSPKTNNIYEIGVGEEIREESRGKFVLASGEQEFTLKRQENSGAWKHNFCVVNVRENEAPPDKQTLPKGSEESRGTVLFDATQLRRARGINNILRVVAEEAAKQGFPDCRVPTDINNLQKGGWYDYFVLSTCVREFARFLTNPVEWALRGSGGYTIPQRRD